MWGSGAGVADTDLWAAPIRGLVLDIDDTLVDTQAAMRVAGARASAVVLPEARAEVHDSFSQAFYADRDGCFDAYTRGEMTFAQQRQRRFLRALADLGLPAELAETFPAFESAYRSAFTSAQVLFDDVRPLLAVATRRGVGVCLLTNSNAELTTLKLQALGIDGVAPVVTTDTIGVGKPDPRLFAAAVELTGAAQAEVVSVGDTLRTDILGARAVGMRAAWLVRPDRPAPRHSGWGTPVDDAGVRVVPSLHEVASLL